MKRAAVSSEPQGEPIPGSSSVSVINPPPPKRSKTARACLTCRQQKSRCELVESGPEAGLSCRRCIHFHIQCSLNPTPSPTPDASNSNSSVMPTQFPHSVPSSQDRETPRLAASSSSASHHRILQDGTSQSQREPLTSTRASRTPPPPSEYATSTPLSPPRYLDDVGIRLPFGGAAAFPFERNNAHRVRGQWGPGEFINYLLTRPPKVDSGISTYRAPPFPFRTRTGPIDATHIPGIDYSIEKGPGTSDAPSDVDPNVKNRSANATTPVDDDDLVARGIIMPEDAKRLSLMWNTHYSSWIPTEQRTVSTQSALDNRRTFSFLRAAQYCLASRHLHSSSLSDKEDKAAGETESDEIKDTLESLQNRLALEIQKSLLEVMLSSGFNSDELSSASVQALNILALWSYAFSGDEAGLNISGHGGGNYDGELFIAIAVRIASSLHIELDVQRLVAERKEGKAGTPSQSNRRREYDYGYEHGYSAVRTNMEKGRTPDQDYGVSIGQTVDDSLKRARLLFKLIISDVILNIGKGRTPKTRVPLRQAEEIFGTASALATHPDSSHGPADARLVLQCSLFDITLRGLESASSIEEMTRLGVEDWVSKINSHVDMIDRWMHLFTPVAALTDPADAIQINVIRIQYQFCKQTILLRSFLLLKKNWPDFRSLVSTVKRQAMITEYVGEQVALWSRQMVKVAESIMVDSLAFRRPPLLSPYLSPSLEGASDNTLPPLPLTSAPDHMYWMMFFGPVFVVKAQLVCLSSLHKPVPRAETSRGLLSRVLEMFREASIPSGSGIGSGSPTLAGRCANILEGMIEHWDKKTAEWQAGAALSRSPSPTVVNGDLLTTPRHEGPGELSPVNQSINTSQQDPEDDLASSSRQRNSNLADPQLHDLQLPTSEPYPQLHNGQDRQFHPQTQPSAGSFLPSQSLFHFGQEGTLPGNVVAGPSFGDLGPFYESGFLFDPSFILDPAFGLDNTFMDDTPTV